MTTVIGPQPPGTGEKDTNGIAIDGGAGYADFGVGFTANYRPVEALGQVVEFTEG